LIHLAKSNTLAAKRQAYKVLGDHALVSRLFGEIAGRFPTTASGFTRIINLGTRRGDNAEMALLELTQIKKKEIKRAKKKKEPVSEEAQKAEPVEGTPEKEREVQKKPESKVAVKEKPPITKKPAKNFLGGLRGIFKKERDSL
jgi:large subunit ribosomal protein L17